MNRRTHHFTFVCESGLRGPHARAIAHTRRRATVHTLGPVAHLLRSINSVSSVVPGYSVQNKFAAQAQTTFIILASFARARTHRCGCPPASRCRASCLSYDRPPNTPIHVAWDPVFARCSGCHSLTARLAVTDGPNGLVVTCWWCSQSIDTCVWVVTKASDSRVFVVYRMPSMTVSTSPRAAAVHAIPPAPEQRLTAPARASHVLHRDLWRILRLLKARIPWR